MPTPGPIPQTDEEIAEALVKLFESNLGLTLDTAREILRAELETRWSAYDEVRSERLVRRRGLICKYLLTEAPIRELWTDQERDLQQLMVLFLADPSIPEPRPASSLPFAGLSYREMKEEESDSIL